MDSRRRVTEAGMHGELVASSRRDGRAAAEDSRQDEYAELVQLIVDGGWHPGAIVRTSKGVRWQFRETPYTTDFPEQETTSRTIDSRPTESRTVRDCPVSAGDGSSDGFVYDPVDQLRHDLKTPLTTISARAYLLARSVRRSPSLTTEERARMLAGVLAIEEAVRAMVVTIDGLGGKSGGSSIA